jgi:hypothetical protein
MGIHLLGNTTTPVEVPSYWLFLYHGGPTALGPLALIVLAAVTVAILLIRRGNLGVALAISTVPLLCGVTAWQNSEEQVRIVAGSAERLESYAAAYRPLRLTSLGIGIGLFVVLTSLSFVMLRGSAAKKAEAAASPTPPAPTPPQPESQPRNYDY